MRNEIEKVLEAMREDYKRWSNWSSSYKPNAHSDKKIMNEMKKITVMVLKLLKEVVTGKLLPRMVLELKGLFLVLL